MPSILILNGASCAGKTTAAALLAQTLDEARWIHPDGIWSDTPVIAPEMLLDRALNEIASTNEPLILVDCQIRPRSVHGLLTDHDLEHWTSVLMDCPDSIRNERMAARGWTDDFGPMTQWAELLRRETRALGHPVLDSSAMSPSAIANRIHQHIKALDWPSACL